QFGQRVVAVLIERPIDLAIDPVVEGKIRVHTHPICIEIIVLDVEGVLAVVEITDFEVLVDLIEHLPAQGYILDFRTADPLDANWPLAGRERLAHDGEQRAALQHLAPFELQHDRENVGAVESVGPLWLERQLAGRHRLFNHPDVEKEGIGALARKYLDAVIPTAILVVSAKRDGTTIRRETAAVLNRAHAAARVARNDEDAVEDDRACTWRECSLWAGCGDVDWSDPKPINDCIGEDCRGARFAEYVHDHDEMLRVVGRRKGKHVRNVGGRISERARSGKMV